jgi:large conductance mechanosensitive channel
MSFLDDFKKFAFKGNVIDLAVGVVIGAAFGKIVSALVDDLIMPVASLMLPGGNWRSAGIVLREAPDPKNNIVLKYGDFMGAVLDFLIVAMVLFIFVSRIIRAIEAKTAVPPAPPSVKECPACFETVLSKATRCKYCTSELTAG